MPSAGYMSRSKLIVLSTAFLVIAVMMDCASKLVTGEPVAGVCVKLCYTKMVTLVGSVVHTGASISNSLIAPIVASIGETAVCVT